MIKYLAVIGCSYTNWQEHNCWYESYPALISKEFDNYFVVDLSIPGGSNNSAYFRLKSFEEFYRIKFDKIIFQLTHKRRDTLFFNEELEINQVNSFDSMQMQNNYIGIKGGFNRKVVDTVTANVFIDEPDNTDRWKNIKKYFNIKSSSIRSVFNSLMISSKGIWETQQQIDLINAVYGKQNVLQFSWFKNLEAPGINSSSGINYPENFIGSIQEAFGDDKFYMLSPDSDVHYGPAGHKEVFDFLNPHLKKLLD